MHLLRLDQALFYQGSGGRCRQMGGDETLAPIRNVTEIPGSEASTFDLCALCPEGQT